MAARPPTNDGDDEPDVIAFGIATIDERLETTELSFPATAQEVTDALGDEVPYGPSGRTMAIETAVEQTGKSSFEHRQELLDALHEVFEHKREQSGGVLSQLRALLPV